MAVRRRRTSCSRTFISIQAPQYRQYALISDFLDLANLSIREEALLATSWIKDRPEGLKLQNLAFATKTGPAMSSLPKHTKADVQYAINKCESLGSGKQLIRHGNPSAIATGFFTAYGSLSTSFFAEYALPMLYDSLGHHWTQFWTSLRPAVNTLLGCSSGKRVQDQLA